MSRAGRIALLAWVVCYAVFYVVVDERPAPVEAVMRLVIPPLLVVAALQVRWALVAAWRARPRRSTSDPAARVLTVAVALLPVDRQAWGRAMLAELASVPGTGARWRFALSCVRATAALPPAGGWPVLALVTALAAASAVAAGFMAVPRLTVFAATFTGLLGALAVLAVARSRRPRLVTPAPSVVVIAAVAASIAATVFFLRRVPTAQLAPPAAVYLAIVLAGCAWVAMAGPRWLGTDRRAAHLGAGAGAAFAVWFLVTVRASETEPPAALVLLFGLALMVTPLAAFFMPAFLAGRAGRSVRAGLRAALWTVVAAVPLSFAIWLPEAMRRHAIDGRSLDGEVIVPAATNLTEGLIFCLGIFPIIGLAVGLTGAALGARRAEATAGPTSR